MLAQSPPMSLIFRQLLNLQLRPLITSSALCITTPVVFEILTRFAKKTILHQDYDRDSKYIIDDFGPFTSVFDQHGISSASDENEDDSSSASSTSTTATTDDNRGAGWTVDKYSYQPVGRRIEKLAFHIAMPLLSPGRIFQYIKGNNLHERLPALFLTSSEIDHADLKSVYVAGLNCLVHQTQ